jgi:dTDP-4-dehydrorhamnose reductase
MTKVMIFGAKGQLGRALSDNAWPRGWSIMLLDRQDCDLTGFSSVVDVIREAKPDLLINAAAYTAVDRAESEPDLAWAVNTLAPAAMAEAANKVGAALVQISSDYVFSGSLGPAWTETDDTLPLNTYGRTKLAGEMAVRAAVPRHLIIRTSWLYDSSAQNFVIAMLRQGLTRTKLTVVNDQFGRPTSAAGLAWAIVRAAKMALEADDHWGTYHMTNSGAPVMRAAFAKAIFAAASNWYENSMPVIEPIPSKAYPSAALRPANSVLDTSKAETVFGIALPPWQDALRVSLSRPISGLAPFRSPIRTPITPASSMAWPNSAA